MAHWLGSGLHVCLHGQREGIMYQHRFEESGYLCLLITVALLVYLGVFLESINKDNIVPHEPIYRLYICMIINYVKNVHRSAFFNI